MSKNKDGYFVQKVMKIYVKSIKKTTVWPSTSIKIKIKTQNLKSIKTLKKIQKNSKRKKNARVAIANRSWGGGGGGGRTTPDFYSFSP
jgi:hypothetical protein